jgi:electron transfer flavoprotein-quinone oxidoreductase
MEKFDVIIIGAGMAGIAAACTLASEGVEVLVLERGDYPGSKNVTGGRIYLNPVRSLFPGLWESAPLERCIVREGVSVMSPDDSVTIDYSGLAIRNSRQSYSIIRSKFDRWFAEQAESRGAMLLTRAKVDDLIIENGKVCGVLTGGDELRSNAVIACDGVLSVIPRKAGLSGPPKIQNYAVGLKEVIALEPSVINARFGVGNDEGCARLFIGEATSGRFGGGFLYTNKDSISLGLVTGIRDAVEGGGIDVPGLLDKFKSRPEISCLIEGGSLLEYSAHVIPEGGYDGLNKLYGNGIMVAGDSAGFALNAGFTVRGMEYALASGHFAARAFLKARELGRFDADTLKCYQDFLEDSFVLKDFRNFCNAPHVLDNPRLFNYYPELLGSVIREIYTVPAGPKENIFPTVKKHLTAGDIWSIVKDLGSLRKL